MEPVDKPRLKICCIASIDEAWMAIRAGASALGLVSAMPSGPGVIEWGLIKHIAAAVPPPIATFLLTCSQNAAEIIEQQRSVGTNTVQICDRLATGTYQELRRGMPGIGIVQVIHVTDEESVDEAVEAARFVDAVLLDSGNQKLEVKELGGTGRTHDWRLSAQIRQAVHVPVFLAGGINKDTALDAIDAVGPFALDICSGLRTEGKLDKEKLYRFHDEMNIGRLRRQVRRHQAEAPPSTQST
jgi:phosphoribosylanthranilate isomerase